MNVAQQNTARAFLNGKLNRRTFVTRAIALGISLGSIEALLAACGGNSGSTADSIRWSNWANTGEIQRFKDFTADYNQKNNKNVRYNFVPSANENYFTKLLTELNGGTAADAFYVGDGDIARLISNKTILQLNDLLESDKSKSRPDSFLDGLWGAARLQDGRIFGVPVDCNPVVLWFNKKVLDEAGITTSPISLLEEGKWTREAFQDMLEKIQAIDKYGFILENSSSQMYAWCITNGGIVYDQDGYGKFVAHEDSKSVEGFQWLADGTKAGIITYTNSLPQGQGSDLAFISNQVGFIAAGRWHLPTFRGTEGLEYDIVPYPSATGEMAPAPIAVAYMAINKKSEFPNETFDFVTNFVSAEGQRFRLQGGGNAVPSVQEEIAEEVVLEGNLPEHAQYFLDARDIGFALFPAEATTPALTTDIQTALEPVWLQGKNVTDVLAEIATMSGPRIEKAQEELQ